MCFNCDNCYCYSMKDDKNINVKFECSKYCTDKPKLKLIKK